MDRKLYIKNKSLTCETFIELENYANQIKTN